MCTYMQSELDALNKELADIKIELANTKLELSQNEAKLKQANFDTEIAEIQRDTPRTEFASWSDALNYYKQNS